MKTKRHTLSRYERRDRAATYLFALPSIIGVLAFFIAPFAVVVAYSVVADPVSMRFVGFDNFKSLFSNTAFRIAIKNTFEFSALAVPLVVVLSLLLALALDANIPGRSRFRTSFITPLMVPVASIVLVWQVMFHQNGSVNALLESLGLAGVDWLKSDYAKIVILLLYLWKNVGYNMILFMSALANVPRDMLEVASLDGAGAIRRFFSIKLRYISPSIIFVSILSLIGSFKIFREVWLLTGDYPYESLYLLQHFINNTFKSLDYQKLSAAALVMCAGMVAVIGLLCFIDAKFGGDADE